LDPRNSRSGSSSQQNPNDGRKEVPVFRIRQGWGIKIPFNRYKPWTFLVHKRNTEILILAAFSITRRLIQSETIFYP
jgi:hypothetical protein